MLRSMTELLGYRVLAADGSIGTVHDFYFDDKEWTTRYLVVDTNIDSPARKVLVSPAALSQPDWKSQKILLTLTTQEVKKSPDVDTNQPISRHFEAALAEHYGWPTYWIHRRGIIEQTAPLEPSVVQNVEVAVNIKENEPSSAATNKDTDPHLRSIQEVVGYHIQARDGEVGHVEDFIVNDKTWTISYVVVDTRNWLPGRKVVIAPSWIEHVKWAEAKVYVDLGQDTIKNSPEYDPSEPVNDEYATKLYDYYGRPKN